jgi:hypothetical protein
MGGRAGCSRRAPRVARGGGKEPSHLLTGEVLLMNKGYESYCSPETAPLRRSAARSLPRDLSKFRCGMA